MSGIADGLLIAATVAGLNLAGQGVGDAGEQQEGYAFRCVEGEVAALENVQGPERPAICHGGK